MLVKVNKSGDTIKILRTTIESFKKNKSYLLSNYPDIDMTNVFCIPHIGA